MQFLLFLIQNNSVNISKCAFVGELLYSFAIISSIWFFQFMWLSICKPRNSIITVFSIYFSLLLVCNAECDVFFVMNSLYLFYLNLEPNY